MYTVTNFKSKKELKEAVAAYNAALALHEQAELPGLSTPLTVTFLKAPAVRYYQPGPFGGNEPKNGTFGCEGPHYPEAHKWYAECTASNGVIVKVK